MADAAHEATGGSELGDSEIDEWAEIEGPTEVISYDGMSTKDGLSSEDAALIKDDLPGSEAQSSPGPSLVSTGAMESQTNSGVPEMLTSTTAQTQPAREGELLAGGDTAAPAAVLPPAPARHEPQPPNSAGPGGVSPVRRLPVFPPHLASGSTLVVPPAGRVLLQPPPQRRPPPANLPPSASAPTTVQPLSETVVPMPPPLVDTVPVPPPTLEGKEEAAMPARTAAPMPPASLSAEARAVLEAAPASASSPQLHPPASIEIEADDNAAMVTGSATMQPVGSGSGWGGWGGEGGGWTRIGASLTQVMGAAVKDVTELGSSFQQVLQEIADDVDVEMEGNAARLQQEAAQSEQTQEDNAVPSGVSEAETQRLALLERLQGPDTPLQRGLKTFDDSVDRVTATTLGTLGTFFSKVQAVASSAALEIRETVEEGAKDISSFSAIKAASTGWAAAAPRHAAGLLHGGEKLAETLGSRAAALLESSMGLTVGGRAQESSDECLSFDQCFYIYGGTQNLEELESLANECARSVNRLRSRLPPAAAAQLDELLGNLGPVFDLQAKDGAAAAAEGRDGSGISCGHQVIGDLCASGCARMQQLASQAVEKAALLATQVPPAAVDKESAHAATSSEAASEMLAGSGPTASDALEPAEVLTGVVDTGEAAQLVSAAQRVLAGVHQAGLRRLAEAAAVSIERLLALARSLAAQFRYGRPADDGISWPADGADKAQLLRVQAQRMAADLASLAAACEDALQKVVAACQAAVAAVAEGEEGGVAVVDGMREDGKAATARLQDGFRGLLYIVLLTTIDRAKVQQ